MDGQPDTVDALYEAWVAKLRRENATLRVSFLLAFVALTVIVLTLTRPVAPKEAPK